MLPSSYPCACGCGEIPTRGKYCRGHWLRLHRRDAAFCSYDDLPEDGPATRASLLDRPAGQLLSAVFADAWDHRQECLRPQSGRYCGQCEQDRVWALATAATFLYSFVNLCEYVGIDPEAARARFLGSAW